MLSTDIILKNRENFAFRTGFNELKYRTRHRGHAADSIDFRYMTNRLLSLNVRNFAEFFLKPYTLVILWQCNVLRRRLKRLKRYNANRSDSTRIIMNSVLGCTRIGIVSYLSVEILVWSYLRCNNVNTGLLQVDSSYYCIFLSLT